MQLPSSRMPKQFKKWTKKRTFNVKLIPSGGVQAWDTEWDGGSKNTYYFANMNGSKVQAHPALGQCFLPFRGTDFILEDSCFCGKDMPLTFHIYPHHLPAFGFSVAVVLGIEVPEQVKNFPLNQLHDWLLERNDPRSKTTERYLSTQPT